MQRRLDSHKGENGKVAVVGGSATMHGAPILSALAAEASGADLVFLALPAPHAPVARTRSLNLQVSPFLGHELSAADVDPLLQLLATVDCAVIGPGLTRSEEGLAALADLVGSAACPLVLDASALQAWTLSAVEHRGCVATPHRGELERMAVAPDGIAEAAKTHGVTIHLKGMVDRIAATDGTVREIPGGNPGLTVGGTGDLLAGLIAGLMAQGLAPADACERASRTVKGIADALAPTYGYAYGAERILPEIPLFLAAVAA